MTVVEIIIAILHCLSNGQRVGLSACMRACICAVNSVSASDQCMTETRDIVRHVGVTIIVMSMNVRYISRYRLIDMNPTQNEMKSDEWYSK